MREAALRSPLIAVLLALGRHQVYLPRAGKVLRIQKVVLNAALKCLSIPVVPRRAVAPHLRLPVSGSKGSHVACLPDYPLGTASETQYTPPGARNQ